MFTLFIENTKVAIQSIKIQKLRTILTVFIIASGIWALVGILFAVSALENSLLDNFALMGTNTFNISRYNTNQQIENSEKSVFPIITYQEAKSYQEELNLPYVRTSISFTASTVSEVSYESVKTDPEVSVLGVDEHFFECSGLKLSEGRAFTEMELSKNIPHCVVGADFVKGLFKDSSPLDKEIVLKGRKFKVIGVLEAKGSLFGNKQDLRVFIPIDMARGMYSQPNIDYEIKTMVQRTELFDSVLNQATIVMRQIRNLSPSQTDNFGVSRSDDMVNTLRKQTMMLTVIAWAVGVITIFGASISLMNIMLVSVTERTKEIGVRKSLGASKSTIRMQFFTETILIAQLGGIVGIVLGLITGYVFTQIVGFAFTFPTMAIVAAIITSFVVAVLSGLYPAFKASNLNPVEALRYE